MNDRPATDQCAVASRPAPRPPPEGRSPVAGGTVNDAFLSYHRPVLTPSQLSADGFDSMLAPLRCHFRTSFGFRRSARTPGRWGARRLPRGLRAGGVDAAELRELPAEHRRAYRISVGKGPLRLEARFQRFRQCTPRSSCQ
jgi:hypothetical protein